MIRSNVRRLGDQRGFALPEMLMSIAVLSVLFALFATVMSTTITQSSQEQAVTVMQTETRAAMERFAQELRQAYSGDSTWPIESVDPASNTIRFLSPDRRDPFHLRRIEWRRSGSDLQRRSVTGTDGTRGSLPAISSAEWTTAARTTEASSIRNTTIFQFFAAREDDGDEPATTDPARVRRVVITLEVSTARQANRRFTYKTSVFPRVSTSVSES